MEGIIILLYGFSALLIAAALFFTVKNTRKLKLLVASAFFVVCFCLFVSAPKVSAATTITGEITQPATWTEENGPYKVFGNVQVKAPLTIEAGTVVKFGTSSLSRLDIKNDFYVKGTRDDPVVFTSLRDDSFAGDTNNDGSNTRPNVSDWLGLNFNPASDKALDIKHAKIFYASNGISIYSSNGHTKNRTVKYSEFKKNGTGIYIYGAEPVIESNDISNNATGILVHTSAKIAKVTNNSIRDNTIGAEGKNYLNASLTALDARENWWGDKTGPKNADGNPDGKGNPVTGKVLFEPWISENPLTTPDPVIIIPGIMGSWEKNGKWQIDPIFHTYDDLIEAFIFAGYKNDAKEMSVFPYQWRDSSIENAKLLHTRIQKIKEDTGRPKVDIVAHSMGGLLAREYIESDYYDNDVDQLITVGTPHLGAPKDYIKWEAGAFFADIFEQAGKKFFEQEAKENGYDSIFRYIRSRPMASVQELLPVYDYLYDDNGSGYDLRIGYPANYPRNEFLENLNDPERVKALGNVDFTKIIGKPEGTKTTISGYNVVNKDMGELWEHGYPHGFEMPYVGDQGIKSSEGDRTVPLHSAEATDISFNKNIYLESSHNNLPTDAQQDILEILTGKRPVEKIDEWQIDDIMTGFIFSPIDFQIISPSGKRLGKNFKTGSTFEEIEGAYYSGFDTNTEFLTIPNPEDGEYKIITQGTGTGEYTVEIAKIAKNADTGEADEAEVSITGDAVSGKQEELLVKVEGMELEKMSVPDPEDENDEDDQNDSGDQNNSSEKNSSGEEQTDIQKLDALKSDVRQYFKDGDIRTRKEAKTITKKLNHIRVHFKKYESANSSKKQRKQKKNINHHIIRLVSRINGRSPKIISELARDYLVSILEELKIE